MRDETRKEQMELINKRYLPKYYEQIEELDFHNPAQEIFDKGQSDLCTARDWENLFAELGVTPETVRDENRLDVLESQKAFLQMKIDRLEENIKAMEDVAPWCIVEDKKELKFLTKRMTAVLKWEANVKEKVDNSLKPKEEKTADYVPTHWMQAKLFWGHILDYVIQEGNKLNKEQVLRLYKKVAEAKRKNNISSWFYYVLADWCVTRLNMPKQKQKLLGYALACKKKAEEAGREWGKQSATRLVECSGLDCDCCPEDKKASCHDGWVIVTVKEKEPEPEVKTRPFFVSLDKIINVDEDGNPWRLEDVIPDHRLSEDEIIDAIDKRRRVA